MWYSHRGLEHCTFVIYACALPEPNISRLSTILKSFCSLCSMHSYEIQRATATKNSTQMHCNMVLAQQRTNFATLRKETVLNIHSLLRSTLDRTAKRNISFKLLSNFLRCRGATKLSKVSLDFCSVLELHQIARRVKRQLSYFLIVN